MTDSKDNGGPAFPSGNDVSVGIYTSSGHAGMTLRDWFAGQALAGLLADPNVRGPDVLRLSAVDAYKAADAMLAERNRK